MSSSNILNKQDLESGQQLHNEEWLLLLTEPVLDALDSIDGPNKYRLRGGGGEVVLANVEDFKRITIITLVLVITVVIVVLQVNQ